MRKTTLTDQYIILKNGFRLAYYDSGQEADNKATVILLHGYCGSSAYWTDLLPQLKEHARVIIPDLRGHGASEAQNGQVYEMDNFAGDILELLDALELKKTALVGHSLGGYITLAAVNRYPERINGFALIHSTALPDSEEAKQNRDKAVQTIRQGGIPAFADGLVPKLFAPKHLESMPEQVDLARRIGHGTSAQGAAATALGMKARPDRTPLVRHATVPVLLVAGAEDQVIPAESTFQGAEGNAGVQTHLLEGAGHMGMLEAASGLAEVLQKFIALI
ncbi:alpha/beta fold hydrolase [Paenibacillus sp. GCM10012307]|uniref:Alpha/beta fold hydrolase n=1 Tax=Paenibacillus roseus TaxID=2798579 RepID=A0A934MNS6_9BACL|nr:alpha/beta hydrolase [Paenibacillus roseus]MBJ6361331.1 alpha/beta fold hydrolase [Paenibacillus roseus]